MEDQTRVGKRYEELKRADLRDDVNLVLPDELMIALALILVPIVIVRVIFTLPANVANTLAFVDYTIIFIFILEYTLKLYASSDRKAFFFDKWHLLDLAIILLPFFDLLPFIDAGLLASSSPILRLLRLSRIFVLGGRATERGAERHPYEEEIQPPKSTIMLNVIYSDLKIERLGIDEAKSLLKRGSEFWLDISGISEVDFSTLADLFGVPLVVVENKLKEATYPRVDSYNDRSLIYLQMSTAKFYEKPFLRIEVHRAGILIVARGKAIITISRLKETVMTRVSLELNESQSFKGNFASLVLYSIVRMIVREHRGVVSVFERALVLLEAIPPERMRHEILASMFQLKREVNRFIPSMIHLKEVITEIISRRTKFRLGESQKDLFELLFGEVEYLLETSENSRDTVVALIDLNINATSYALNRALRLVAVLTTLTVIPTVVGGLLGINARDQPFPILLYQAVLGTAIGMALTAYVFYRLGWLKT